MSNVFNGRNCCFFRLFFKTWIIYTINARFEQRALYIYTIHIIIIIKSNIVYENVWIELGNLSRWHHTVAGLSSILFRVACLCHYKGGLIGRDSSAGWVEFYFFVCHRLPTTIRALYLLTCITDPIKPHDEDPPDDDGCYYTYYITICAWSNDVVPMSMSLCMYNIMHTRVKGTRGTCPELVSVFTWQ